MDTLFQGWWPLAASERGAIVAFNRADHLKNMGFDDLPLAAAVRTLVERETGQRPEGPIRLLTHLRYFGYCFNPVSFYFCYSRDSGEVETIVAEVSNTPWCVLPRERSGEIEWKDGVMEGWKDGRRGKQSAFRRSFSFDCSRRNEMHCYVLNPRAKNVQAQRLTSLPLAESDASSAPSVSTPAPELAWDALPTTTAATAARVEGATNPVGATERADAASSSSSSSSSFSSPSSSSSSSPSSCSSSSSVPRPRVVRQRYQWSKTFHVSPFMDLGHIYDWVFAFQNASEAVPSSLAAGDVSPSTLDIYVRSTLDLRFAPSCRAPRPHFSHLAPLLPLSLSASPPPFCACARACACALQSRNLREGKPVFTARLHLDRTPLTRSALAYFALLWFPLLTLKIQWLIHWEALKLWWKGAPYFDHPQNATTGFTRLVAALMAPLFFLVNLFGTAPPNPNDSAKTPSATPDAEKPAGVPVPTGGRGRDGGEGKGGGGNGGGDGGVGGEGVGGADDALRSRAQRRPRAVS